MKIRILRLKLVINCVTCAGANLRFLLIKISDLRQKIFIICATRAGVNLSVLAFKISVLRQKFVIIVGRSSPYSELRLLPTLIVGRSSR